MAMNINKRTSMSATMLLASVGVISTAFSSVYADTGGGSGNGVCVNTCNAAHPFTWRVVSSGGGKSAYTKFAGDTMNSWGNNGTYRGYTEGQAFPRLQAYGMTNNQLLQACKNSDTIWWLSSSKPFSRGKANGWIWNANIKSFPSTFDGGSFDNAYPMAGSSVNQGTKDAAHKWITAAAPSGKLTVVCSGVFENGNNPGGNSGNPTPSKTPGGGNPTGGTPGEPKTRQGETYEESEKRSNVKQSDSKTFTQPYSYITEVTRQITKDGKDPIGKANLHNQPAVAKNTKFSELHKDVTDNPDKYSTYSPSQIEELVNKAIEEDARSNHAQVNLDDKNKKGLAEGGILNIKQQTRMATITARHEVIEDQVRTCKVTPQEVLDEATGSWVTSSNPPTRVCGAWKTTGTSDAMTAGTQLDATPKQSAFWQILSVHCNKPGFEALMKNAQGAKVMDSGDASKALSAVAYSKIYTSMPDILDFGDPNNTNPALKASSELGFFDKECPFDCKADPNGKGASTQNGATKNVSHKNANPNGSYGASSENKNDRDFSFFRDNMKHLISVDVWYPESSDVVKYSGGAPLSTTVNSWAEGTPSILDPKDSGQGGKFTMTTKDGREMFKGTDTPSTQKNFATDTFSSTTSEQMAGLVRDFSVQATWASEKNKPQTFNFKWEYAPTVNTKAVATGIGFNAKNEPIEGTPETLPATIQGKCYGVFKDTANSINLTDIFAANTGTGSKNNLDGGVIDGGKDKVNNLYVNFVRSTTE